MSVTATSPGLSALHQIALPVQSQQLSRAVAFYQNTLCIPHLFTFGTLAFFGCWGVRLLLSEPERDIPFSPANTFLYFRADDIHAAYNTLAEQGVEFEQAPHIVGSTGTHDVWLAAFRDTEGNPLALMSEVPTRTDAA